MAGVNVTIGADSSKAQRELASFQKKTRKIASSIAKGFQLRIGQKLFDGLANAAARLPDFFKGAIEAASSLNEELGKSQAVFGASASEIEKWSKTTADAFGISSVQALQATGTFGNMLRAFDIAGSEAASMSRELVELAADMGSFNNASIEDTIFAIGAALRGENEPIRKFGVALDDARLKSQALEMGLYSGKGALDANAKAMASYALIIKQTSIQQGNFAETADDLENSKKKLQAKFEDLKAVIGESLLPVVKDFITTLQEADFEAIGNSIASLAGSFADLTDFVAKAHQGWVWFKEDLENFNFTDALRDLFGMESPDGIKFSPTSDDEDAWLNLARDAQREEDLKAAQKEQEEVDKSNSDFRKKLKEEEDEGNRRRALKDEEIRRKGIIKGIRDEYKNTLKILDARIKGDKEFLEQEELKKEIEEERNKSAKDGYILARESAEKIVMKRREAEQAEQKRAESAQAAKKKTEEDKAQLQGEISKAESSVGSAMTRSSITAVSSMQSIGGGGGVYGELNLQKTQTDLQRQLVTLQQQMVGLLEGVKTGVGQEPVAQ